MSQMMNKEYFKSSHAKKGEYFKALKNENHLTPKKRGNILKPQKINH